MLIQVEKDLPDMKHIKAVAGYILILSLCLVCAHPAHAETRRIALIHSFEPGYPPAAKALELLQKEFSLLGLDCDVREYYLDWTATWRRQKTSVWPVSWTTFLPGEPS